MPRSLNRCLCGTTSGIEPMFAVAYVWNVLGGQLVELNPLFERVARSAVRNARRTSEVPAGRDLQGAASTPRS